MSSPNRSHPRSKRILQGILLLAILFGVRFFYKTAASSSSSSHPSTSTKKQAEAQEEIQYTCPMHPEVRQNHPGECPICHMKLVKVKQKSNDSLDVPGDLHSAHEAHADVKTSHSEKRSIYVSESSLDLIGVQKHEVEKMDLKVLLPVSGRILSQSQVAFQVYEKDLRYVKAGLLFQGEDSIYSEEEIEGVVSSVDSLVDPTSRTVRVVGSIRKGPKKLLAESSFRGELVIELKDRVAIPESSVLHSGSGDWVYLVNKPVSGSAGAPVSDTQTLTPKKVSLGLKTEGFYEVLSGVQVGDEISSGPNFLLDSEAKLRGVQ